MNCRKNPATIRARVVIAAIFTVGGHSLAQAGEDSYRRDDIPPVPTAMVEICVGDLHSCALADNGEVACWGDNERFQIAPTTAQFHEPHVIREFPKAASLRCGAYRTCVRTVAGEILCRGRSDGRLATIALPGPARDFVIHAAGGCAILDRGKVFCWHGDGEEVLAIEAATGATGFALAAPSAERVCVIRSNAAPVCFDAVLWPAVPQGATPVPSAPRVSGVVVEEFTKVRDLLLVNSGLCGRFADGHVRCTPKALADAWNEVIATEVLATDGSYACLRRRDNTITCADVTGHGGRSQPDGVAKGIPAGASKLALSKGHGCAVVGGLAKCWGKASHGQIGDKTSYLHATPTRVPGIDDAVALRVAETMACVIRKGGMLSCWGALGERAVPGSFPGFSPVKVAFPGPVADVFVGSPSEPTRLCAKGAKGWRCYAQGQWTASAKPPGPSAGMLARVGGRLRGVAPDGYCAVDSKGRIICGHCGACTLAEARSIVTRISDKPAFVEVAALIKLPSSNDTLICGRNTQKRVHCARSHDIPFQHDSSPIFIDEPTIAALDNVERIVALGVPRAEANLVCALTRAGAVHCWGDGQYGQLGGHQRTWRVSAEPVLGLPPVVELGVGGTFACARTEQGQIYCWGSNREGAVPDGAPGECSEAVVNK